MHVCCREKVESNRNDRPRGLGREEPSKPSADHQDALKLFERHFELIERVIAGVGRSRSLRPHDFEDFRSQVLLLLLQDDCAALRSFRGDAKLDTYLKVLVAHAFRDFCVERWGRYRASKRARALGLDAVKLESLLERDGFTLEEAIETMLSHAGTSHTRQELRELAAELPGRPRRRFEDETSLEHHASPGLASDQLEADEVAALQANVRGALADAVGRLDPDDRLLLKLRYQDGLTLKEVATALGFRQRLVYSRHDRCLGLLRRQLEAKGISWQEVQEVLGRDVDGGG